MFSDPIRAERLGIEPFDPYDFMEKLTTLPGVYAFKNALGQYLYIGKAANLHQRIRQHYLHLRKKDEASVKVQHMLAQVAAIDISVTQSEKEALLLEIQLIKAHRPRYNVVFRDDKTYPYFWLSAGPSPRLTLYRGARKEAGEFFGPYPENSRLKAVFSALQKVFGLRTCDDAFFAARTRPCLQYQIGRCSAPCVGKIDPVAYTASVDAVRRLLSGDTSTCVQSWTEAMQIAAAEEKYEEAGRWRDLIASVQRMVDKQVVCLSEGDCDVWAVLRQGTLTVIHGLRIQAGQILLSQNFFPTDRLEQKPEIVLSAFLVQYYQEAPIPQKVFLNVALEDKALCKEILEDKAGHAVSIGPNKRDTHAADWLAMAASSAQAALETRLAKRSRYECRKEALEKLLGCTTPLNFIEGFDISHWMGQSAIAACVAFDAKGPDRRLFRRYEAPLGGDDVNGMAEILRVHYHEHKEAGRPFPDLVLIDGGEAQLKALVDVFTRIQASDTVLMAIAKGPTRRPGNETIYLHKSREPGSGFDPYYTGIAQMRLLPQDPALHFLQQVRDAAHRLAIESHKKKREKKSMHSILEDIPGVGPVKRKRLLERLGGLQGLKRASQEAILMVEGIDKRLAERIYAALHNLEA